MGANIQNTPVRWTRRIDTFLRFLDLATQRFDADTEIGKWLKLERHTALSYLWPALVCTAVLIGMPVISMGRVVAAIATFAGALLLLLSSARFTRDRGVKWDALAQCALVLACCVLTAVVGARSVPVAGGLYLHALVPIAAIFAGSIVIAAFITPLCFQTQTQDTTYPPSIEATQLFQHRPPPQQASWGTLSQGVILALVRAPELLLLPCFVAMLARTQWVTWYGLGLVAVIPLTLLVIEGLDERVEQILKQLSSRFFLNGALLVSLVVIALGLARTAGISYVTTVLDTAAAWQIVTYLCFAYAMVWWQDYWIERFSGQEMLRIAGGAAVTSKDACIAYDFRGDNKGIRVPSDKRRIQLHGIGRFLILRPDTFQRSTVREQPPPWVGDQVPAFHTWTFAEFFTHVAACAHPYGDAQPSPQRIRQRLLQHAMMVRVCTGLALGAVGWALHLGMQAAAATATNRKDGPVNLKELIASHPADRPVILVAASGGGTRAALYTAAVLEGLARQGAIDDVVLGSGVSGGGASLAYFAARRHGIDWDRFFTAMQTAFIQDVLERSCEWRMVAEMRLGTLLEESFRHHWELPEGRTEIGDIKDMGLIFNTTIAGHFRAKTAGNLAVRASKDMDKHETKLAGGRLIITNLATTGMFKDVNGPYETRLPVVVNDSKFELVTAAALNANFPPVFSNAPVDVDERDRYWVTDGGAADNRGVEMLLYALRRAKAEDATAFSKRRMLVLIVDAGAAPGRYSQDRGLGSAMGAGTQFAMHLVAELQRDLGPNVVLLHMPMPQLLRASFGTHWMLQGTIAVKNGDASINVPGTEMVEVLRGLYARGNCTDRLGESGKKACRWAEQTAAKDWNKVRDWIAGTVPTGTATMLGAAR